MKADKETWDRLTGAILYGMGHDRASAKGDAAYAEAEKVFSPHQMGRLHHLMAVRCSDLEYNEIMSGAY